MFVNKNQFMVAEFAELRRFEEGKSEDRPTPANAA
jgi:hypothetical protein